MNNVMCKIKINKSEDETKISWELLCTGQLSSFWACIYTFWGMGINQPYKIDKSSSGKVLTT